MILNTESIFLVTSDKSCMCSRSLQAKVEEILYLILTLGHQQQQLRFPIKSITKKQFPKSCIEYASISIDSLNTFLDFKIYTLTVNTRELCHILIYKN